MAVGVVAAACGADELPGVPRIGTSPGKVIYATWGAPGVREAEHWTLLSFEKNYTDLKVDVVLTGDDERAYLDRLRAMVAAGSDPDVMRLPGPDATGFFASGSMLKLDAVVRRDGFRPDSLAGPFDGSTWRKSWHGFPRGRTAEWGIFFDRGRFAQAGVPEPAPTWSWDDLVAAGRRLTDPAADRWGVALCPIADFLQPWIWGAGGDDLDRAGEVASWDSPPAREAIEWVHGLRHLLRIAPPAGTHGAIGAMASGRVAMWFGCADDEFALRRAGASDFGFAPQPRGRAGQSGAWHPDVVSIGARAPNPDDAWELLQFLVDPDTQRLEFDQGLWLPQAKSITDEARYRKPSGAPHDRRAGIAGAIIKPRSPVLVPGSGPMRRAVASALGPYWRGEASTDAAIAAASEAARAALSGYGRDG